MKKSLLTVIVFGVSFGIASTVAAIPTLQLGSEADSLSSQGTYVDYTTVGSDEDTAFISGDSTLLAAGRYRKSDWLNVGGKYDGGDDWSIFSGFSDSFNGHGAIIMATVADESIDNASVTLKLTYLGITITSFLQLDEFSGYPNRHYPVGDGTTGDSFFFDIGDFLGTGIAGLAGLSRRKKAQK